MPTGVTTMLSGSVKFEGRELIGLPEAEIKLRGKSVGFISRTP